MVRKKDVQTPAGTTKGGGVYPLAPTLPYIQEVTPVTIVSAIDNRGKQQPFAVAPETGIIDAYELQGGSAQTIANGGSLISDTIDCSLHDSIVFYFACSVPQLGNTLNIDMVSQGILTADNGFVMNLQGYTTAEGLQILEHGNSITTASEVLDDVHSPSFTPNMTQYKICNLHGMSVAILLRNGGDTGAFDLYYKLVGFKGA